MRRLLPRTLTLCCFFSVSVSLSLVGAAQKGAECRKPLRDLGISIKTLQASVAENSELVRSLSQFADDPLMPVPIRRVIHESLAQKQTTVALLTARIREELGKDPNVLGTFVAQGDGFPVPGGKFVYFGNAPEMRGTRNRGFKVFVEDPSDQSILLHELAHVRLMSFLDKNFQTLAARGNFPAWAVRKVQGHYYLHGSFSTYLEERYAYEIQNMFEIHHSNGWSRHKIVTHILDHYPTTRDDRLRKFDEMPVASILLGRNPGEFPTLLFPIRIAQLSALVEKRGVSVEDLPALRHILRENEKSQDDKMYFVLTEVIEKLGGKAAPLKDDIFPLLANVRQSYRAIRALSAIGMTKADLPLLRKYQKIAPNYLLEEMISRLEK